MQKTVPRKRSRKLKVWLLLWLVSVFGVSVTYGRYQFAFNPAIDQVRVAKYDVAITNQGISNSGEILEPEKTKPLVLYGQKKYEVSYTIKNNSEVWLSCFVTVDPSINVNAGFIMNDGNTEVVQQTFQLAPGAAQSFKLSVSLAANHSADFSDAIALNLTVSQLD